MLFEEFRRLKEGRKMAFAAVAGNERGWGIGITVLGESGYYEIEQLEGVDDTLGLSARYPTFEEANDHATKLNESCFSLTPADAAMIVASSMAPKPKRKP